MLRDQYAKDKLFTDILLLVPKMDPILAKIDGYLNDDELFSLIRADLAQRWPKTLETGRNSTPVEVVLRMLVVKRLYGYSYAETERYVGDSLVLRQFCRLYLNRVPDDTTLIKWANLIQEETLQQFNERITQLALEHKITKGKKLRTDGTVVETNIHAPSDNRQLADGVRVLTRIRQKIQKLQPQSKAVKEDLTKAARDVSRKIGETLRQRTDEAKAAGAQLYQELIEMAQKNVTQAKQVLEHLDSPTVEAMKPLKTKLETFVSLVAQVIDQTQRRVFEKELVPAQEKVVSLFEPHTDIIVRGKDTKPVEYGHKIWLNEVDGGIVSHYRILKGNPSDEAQWEPSLQAHQTSFRSPPEQASADRGVSSAPNEKIAKDLGIEHAILPKRGYKSKARREYEQQGWFVEGRKWHAGVEGRISVLKRAHGLGRCLNHGEDGFHRWVGWGVIAGNLAVMGRA